MYLKEKNIKKFFFYFILYLIWYYLQGFNFQILLIFFFNFLFIFIFIKLKFNFILNFLLIFFYLKNFLNKKIFSILNIILKIVNNKKFLIFFFIVFLFLIYNNKYTYILSKPVIELYNPESYSNKTQDYTFLKNLNKTLILYNAADVASYIPINTKNYGIKETFCFFNKNINYIIESNCKNIILLKGEDSYMNKYKKLKNLLGTCFYFYNNIYINKVNIFFNKNLNLKEIFTFNINDLDIYPYKYTSENEYKNKLIILPKNLEVKLEPFNNNYSNSSFSSSSQENEIKLKLIYNQIPNFSPAFIYKEENYQFFLTNKIKEQIDEKFHSIIIEEKDENRFFKINNLILLKKNYNILLNELDSEYQNEILMYSEKKKIFTQNSQKNLNYLLNQIFSSFKLLSPKDNYFCVLLNDIHLLTTYNNAFNLEIYMHDRYREKIVDLIKLEHKKLESINLPLLKGYNFIESDLFAEQQKFIEKNRKIKQIIKDYTIMFLKTIKI